MMMKYLLLILVVTLSVSYSSGQSTVKAIDKYAKGIDGYVASKKNAAKIFADTSDVTDASKPSWRRFASEKALEKYRESSETYSTAYTWMRGGKLIAASFTFSSASGDWVKYAYHFFRPNGTLAKLEIDYRTFHGDFIAEQNSYFSSTGKLLKRTTVYKDLQTGKPMKPHDGDISDNSGLLAGDTYKTVRKLPFARLIKK